MSDRNFSPKKAFEALTPKPVASFWSTSRSGVRVDVSNPHANATTQSNMPSANIVLKDNVDVYDAAQLAVFFAKLSVHLGNDDTRVVEFAQSGSFD